MKQRILKIISITLVALSLLLCSCTGKIENSGTSSDAQSESTAENRKLVFVQYDNSYRENEMRETFISRMRLLGYDSIRLKTDVKNAQCNQEKLVEIFEALKSSDYDLIITIGNEASLQASKSELKAPCVFVGAESPVENGLATNPDAPDKNMTGTVMNTSDKKTASLIRIFTPEVKAVGILVSYDNTAALKNAESFQKTAKAEGISAQIYKIENPDNAEGDFANIISENDALFFPDDAKLNPTIEKAVELCANEKKFVFASSTTAVSNGALAAYCSSPVELSNKAALAADEIFKGKKPSEIPIDFSVEGNIFLSSKTYSRLGIGVPDIDGLIVI